MSSFDRDDLGPDLSAYIDGELPAEQLKAIERRLEQSPSDRQTVRKLRDIVQQLGGLPRHAAPIDVAESVLAALRAGGSGAGSASAARATIRARRLIWLARGAAAAAVFVGGVFVGARLAPLVAVDAPSGLETVRRAPARAPEGRFAGGEREADREKVDAPQDALLALGYVGEPATESSEVRLGAPLGGGEAGAAGGEMPEVVVNVNPRTLDEFNGAVRFVNDVAEAVGDTTEAGKDTARSKLSYQPSGQAQSLVLTVDAGQVLNVIEALDNTVQQNTNVAMNFAGSQARRIYQSADVGSAVDTGAANAPLAAPGAAGETGAVAQEMSAGRGVEPTRGARDDKKEAPAPSEAPSRTAARARKEPSEVSQRAEKPASDAARPAYSDAGARDADGLRDELTTSAPHDGAGVAGRAGVGGERRGRSDERDVAGEGVAGLRVDAALREEYGVEPGREPSIEEQVLRTLQKARAERADWNQRRNRQIGNQVLFRVQIAPPPAPASAPAARRARP